MPINIGIEIILEIFFIGLAIPTSVFVAFLIMYCLLNNLLNKLSERLQMIEGYAESTASTELDVEDELLYCRPITPSRIANARVHLEGFEEGFISRIGVGGGNSKLEVPSFYPLVKRQAEVVMEKDETPSRLTLTKSDTSINTFGETETIDNETVAREAIHKSKAGEAIDNDTHDNEIIAIDNETVDGQSVLFKRTKSIRQKKKVVQDGNETTPGEVIDNEIIPGEAITRTEEAVDGKTITGESAHDKSHRRKKKTQKKTQKNQLTELLSSRLTESSAILDESPEVTMVGYEIHPTHAFISSEPGVQLKAKDGQEVHSLQDESQIDDVVDSF